jgi:hypothetical protein
LAKRFSLVTLRASQVVARYLEKPDLAEAAKRLGHERLSFNQIERYVPPPLIAFFEERWVRLFQNAVLCEALVDSQFLLRATDFETMDDLHEFLSNHALKIRRRTANDDNGRDERGGEQVYFSANTQTLAILLALRTAVRAAQTTPCVLAIEWADFADRLQRYIESAQPPREELVVMLEEAREKANVVIFNETIYA